MLEKQIAVSGGFKIVRKSVSDLICDKFAEAIQKNELFKGTSDDLITAIRKRRPNKTKIKELLRKK